MTSLKLWVLAFLFLFTGCAHDLSISNTGSTTYGEFGMQPSRFPATTHSCENSFDDLLLAQDADPATPPAPPPPTGFIAKMTGFFGGILGKGKTPEAQITSPSPPTSLPPEPVKPSTGLRELTEGKAAEDVPATLIEAFKANRVSNEQDLFYVLDQVQSFRHKNAETTGNDLMTALKNAGLTEWAASKSTPAEIFVLQKLITNMTEFTSVASFNKSVEKVTQTILTSKDFSGKKDEFKAEVLFFFYQLQRAKASQILSSDTQNEAIHPFQFIAKHIGNTSMRISMANHAINKSTKMTERDLELFIENLPRGQTWGGTGRWHQVDANFKNHRGLTNWAESNTHESIDLVMLQTLIGKITNQAEPAQLTKLIDPMIEFIQSANEFKSKKQQYQDDVTDYFARRIWEKVGVTYSKHIEGEIHPYLQFVKRHIKTPDEKVRRYGHFAQTNSLSIAELHHLLRDFPKGANFGSIGADAPLIQEMKSLGIGNWGVHSKWEPLDRQYLYHAIKNTRFGEGKFDLIPAIDRLAKEILQNSRDFKTYKKEYIEQVYKMLEKLCQQMPEAAQAYAANKVRLEQIQALKEKLLAAKSSEEMSSTVQEIRKLSHEDESYADQAISEVLSSKDLNDLAPDAIRFLSKSNPAQTRDLIIDQYLSGRLHPEKFKTISRSVNINKNEIQSRVLDQILNGKSNETGLINEKFIADILKSDAGKFENLFKQKFDKILKEQGAAPSNRVWSSLMEMVPQAQRAEFTKKLLESRASSPEQLVQILANLHPVEGVQRAVADFLSTTTVNLSDAQIIAIFQNSLRLKQFFPWISGSSISVPGAFKLAIGTNPRIHDSHKEPLVAQLRAGLSFQPRTLMGEVRGDVGNNFSNNLNVLKGLIIQGYYEKNGQSLMRIESGARGSSQVESDAPSMMRAIHSATKSGLLTNRFFARLFAKNWNLGTDGRVIESMRSRAIWIANRDRSFWNLRVAIHNFPNMEVLKQTRTYRNGLQDGELKNQVTTIIREIEFFLGINDGGASRNLKTTIDRLAASNESKAKITKIMTEYENMTDPLARLDIVHNARVEWMAIKQKSSSDTAAVDYFLGDSLLQDYALSAMNEFLAKLGPIKTEIEFAGMVKFIDKSMDHLILDDVFTSSQKSSYQQSLHQLMQDGSLPLHEKSEIAVQIMSNLVDQVYFKYQDAFGTIDGLFHSAFSTPGTAIVKFVDDGLRSGSVSSISRLADSLAADLAAGKNIKHRIADQETLGAVDIYNPGDKVGTLRFNQDPMTLTPDDIAVFTEMPTEVSSVGGIVTVGVGARLSHLQLLARSTGLPNVRVSKDFIDDMKRLDGQRVRLVASKNGSLTVELASADATNARRSGPVQIPEPDFSVDKPVTFAEASKISTTIAGPKGMVLSKLRALPHFAASVPNGIILPFGFFRRYTQETGIRELIEILQQTETGAESQVAVLSAQIRRRILDTPVPEKLLDEVMTSLEKLKEETGSEGFFFRSDTNIEDLPQFNGAGINKSVANVKIDRAAVEDAIKKVWVSPFEHKSITWRSMAVGTPHVPIAEPSIVVMPTVQAQSSGVIISKGTAKWVPGRGRMSSNWGIGSVVEAGRPTEEISFEPSTPLIYSYTVSTFKPVANAAGGLKMESVEAGVRILTEQQMRDLNDQAQQIERDLGSERHGWDIEWAVDMNGKIHILQARPNVIFESP